MKRIVFFVLVCMFAASLMVPLVEAPGQGGGGGATNDVIRQDHLAQNWVYNNISIGGKNYYVRIFVAGSLHRADDDSDGGHEMVQQGSAALREYVLYVQKKPKPVINVSMPSEHELFYANFTSGIYGKAQDRSINASNMIQDLRNISLSSTVVSNKSGDWQLNLTSGTSSGSALFEQNMSGKVLKVSLFGWERLPNSAASVSYMASRDSKNYYNISDNGNVDFESINMSVAADYADPNQNSNGSLSQLRINVSLKSDGVAANTPLIIEFAVETEFVGNGIGNGTAFIPAKFWTFYNGEEDFVNTTRYDSSETHISNTTGDVKQIQFQLQTQ